MREIYPNLQSLHLPDVAKKILAFWEDQAIFQKTLEKESPKGQFTFFEGPPSANGKPGIHHILSRTLKDTFCRYKTQCGYQVPRKAGWDTHGLPVELQVEKKLGIKKEDIGQEVSVEAYNEACKETVLQYQALWNKVTEKMGYWVDLQDPYITFKPAYIESLWHILKQLHEKEVLYKGYTIQPYSPAAGTGLSNHELNQPGCYKMVKDTSLVAQFQLKGEENTYLLAWTTTPWTLPANSALAIHPKLPYLQIETYNPYTKARINVILAEGCIERYFTAENEVETLPDTFKNPQKLPWRRVKAWAATDLIGKSYQQLMPYIQPQGKAFEIIPADFVTTKDGTGIVHIAPTFGSDDMQAAKINGIEAITITNKKGEKLPIVDKQGRFIEAITDYAGCYVKAAYEEESVRNKEGYLPVNVRIAIDLKQKNKAFKVEKYEHSYPHCWRTDKPVLYYPLDSWFIQTTAYKEKLIEYNKTINWKPEATGKGRFGNWLENLVDWNLSRDRFWGTPLPIWKSKDGKHTRCIGSLVELRAAVEASVEKGHMKAPLPEGFDPHKPYIDQVVLVSEEGTPMYREPDLVDVWFDSGAMPYAQWHYPFENEELFQASFPADFIAEGVDQTRGWFFTLHVLGVILFDQPAYKNVIANGLVLDKEGNKMSKRLGNAIDPMEVLEQQGPDALRWYMIGNSQPGENMRFDGEEMVKVQRRFFGTLHNTYSFFSLYANLDGFRPIETDVVPLERRPQQDRWILARLTEVIEQVQQAYDGYDPTRVVQLLQYFVVEDVSNWYVRLNRKRFWKSEYNENKIAAYQTLHECLCCVAQMGAPVAPFYMEELYRSLHPGTEESISVHLSNFPAFNPAYRNISLLDTMQWARTVSSLGHALRKKEKIKVRQPLEQILVPVRSEEEKERYQQVLDLVCIELNVKEVQFVDGENTVIHKEVKPNYPRLGKAYGAKMKAVAQAISQMDQAAIRSLEVDGAYALILPEEKVSISLTDVEIVCRDIPGWRVASQGAVTVALDTTITEELWQEGLARELVNRIQNLRKDVELEVQDKIHLALFAEEKVIDALQAHREYIEEEVQATSLQLSSGSSKGIDIEIEGAHITVHMDKAS